VVRRLANGPIRKWNTQSDMTHRDFGWRAVGLALALFAACGGSTKPPNFSTTTTNAQTATVSQIASIIATYEPEIRRLVAGTESCHLGTNPACGLSEQLQLLALDSTASTLDIELRAAAEARPGNQLYRGAYPDEIAPLVASTRAAIASLASAMAAYRAADCGRAGSPAGSCGPEGLGLATSTSGLIARINAWRPYL
jgi:hypothetical protein